MGTVYKARDPGLDRLVALKTIVSAAVDSEEARERFFREARAAARLQHPNIVTVFEAGDFEGTLSIAMELLEGQDLSRVIHIPRSVEDKVKIMDFGIARLGDALMTQTGLVLGTPSYVAPEALSDGRVDHRADQWAVGIVLYELLAGRRPYASPTFTTLAYQIVNEPLPPLGHATPGLPTGLWEVAAKALAKSPSDRYQDLAHMRPSC